MVRVLPILASAALVVSVTVSWGCVSPRHGGDTPPVTRVITVPPGATLRLVDSNREWITPFDVTSPHFGTGSRIVISKAGYRDFSGTLADAPQIGDGVYRIELEPLDRP